MATLAGVTSPQSRPRRSRERKAGAATSRGAARGATPRATPGTAKPGNGRDASGSTQDQAPNPPDGRQDQTSNLPDGRQDQTSSPPEGSSTPRTAGRTLASVVSGLQALALLGICGFYAVGLARGESDNPVRVVMSIVLIAIFAVALAVLAVAWWRGAGWPGTPTAVWNALLLPVAWGLFQGGQGLIGGTVLVVALLGLLAALTSGSRRELP